MSMNIHERVRQRRWLVPILLLLTFCFAGAVQAEVAVIGSSGTSLTVAEVKALYLGKSDRLPDGTVAKVIDLPSGHPVRDNFYQTILDKNASQMKSYWAKRIFTGKGSPPESVTDESAVISWVKGGPGRIGYIDARSVDGSVHVLLRK